MPRNRPQVTRQNQANEIFADDFERRLSLPFNKADREDFPCENRKNGDRGQDGVRGERPIWPDRASARQKQQRDEQRHAFHVARHEPELVGVVVVIRENRHAVIRQGMQQIYAADEKIGNRNERQIAVFDVLAGIPGDHEHRPRHDDAEEFGQGVK